MGSHVILVGVSVTVDGDSDIDVIVGKCSLVLVVHVVRDCGRAVCVVSTLIVGSVCAHQQRCN